MTLKADLTRKQVECAELETQAEGLNEQLRQFGLKLETAQKASDHKEQHRAILLRDAQERAESALNQLHQLQSDRSSSSPDQQRMEELLLQNGQLREHTGELMARVEDAEAAQAELRARNATLEKEAKLMRVDLATFSFFSPTE